MYLERSGSPINNYLMFLIDTPTNICIWSQKLEKHSASEPHSSSWPQMLSFFFVSLF